MNKQKLNFHYFFNVTCQYYQALHSLFLIVLSCDIYVAAGQLLDLKGLKPSNLVTVEPHFKKDPPRKRQCI